MTAQFSISSTESSHIVVAAKNLANFIENHPREFDKVVPYPRSKDYLQENEIVNYEETAKKYKLKSFIREIQKQTVGNLDEMVKLLRSSNAEDYLKGKCNPFVKKN